MTTIRNRGLAALICLAALAKPAWSSEAVNVAQFVQRDVFLEIKISPDGDYLAATVPMEDRTALVILKRVTKQRTSVFALGKDTHVDDFHWVSPTRVIFGINESFGMLDQPVSTGELYAVDADGKDPVNLVGFRANSGAAGGATRVRPRVPERVRAYLVDALPDNDKGVLVSIAPFSSEPQTRAESMDVSSGRRTLVASIPARNASFHTDNAGSIRLARGSDKENFSKLYYRASQDAEWQLINDESKTARVETVLGFSPDDTVAYLQVEQPRGPDAIVAYDTGSGERRVILRDDNVDPWLVLRQNGKGDAPVGVMFMDGVTRTEFFDPASVEAKLYRSLETAFPGQSVLITSTTDDGRHALVEVSSGSNPGDFYIFDAKTMEADHVISRRQWVAPERMAKVEPFTLEARDGLDLHGYMTLPPGGQGKRPMVVLPHGGPFGEFDTWQFHVEAQMLARAGYVVLQPNFRGSGNYGRFFNQAGAREWGRKMQDDLTDATRWAIAQGVADPGRICIYGASYGAYAAMVGVASEHGLYRCAAGYVGVYDLEKRHYDYSLHSDSRRIWANDWMGPKGTLAAVSPVNMAGQIKVPVFLAAGGEDSVAPIEHSEKLEKALERAGVPVKTLYYPTEGHGFYTPARQVEYYSQLLEFLSEHLGGAKAKPAAEPGS